MHLCGEAPSRGPSHLDFRESLSWSCLFLAIAVVFCAAAQAATLTVTTQQDEVNSNGQCSLREAVLNANNNDQSASTDCPAGAPAPTVDEIRFDASLDGTPIELSMQGSGATGGDLDVSESVKLVGNGLLEVDPAGFQTDQARTVISASGVGDRILDANISDGVNRLSITGTALIDGEAGNGGAISVGSGSVTFELDSVVLASNKAVDGVGGAIVSSAGTVRIESVLFLDNIAESTDGQAQGGALVVTSSADSTEISNSGFFRNRSVGATGSFGGALSVSSVALPHDGEQLLIENSVFEANQSEDAVDSADDFGDDRAYAGAIYKGSNVACRIRQTTISGNAAIAADRVAIGGGVVLDRPQNCLIENSTISDNVARSDSPTPANGFSQGGGLALLGDDHQVALNNVTVTRNYLRGSGSNSFGGGVFTFDYDTGNATDPTFLTSNTIIAGNVDEINDDAPDCSATVESVGYTLLGDNRFCDYTFSSGDLVGDVNGGSSAIEYPQIFADGPTDNGGGFTVGTTSVSHKTHSLYPTSLAVDAGDPLAPGGGGSCASLDQRGVARPLDGDSSGEAICDMGAFELEPPPDLIFEDRFAI